MRDDVAIRPFVRQAIIRTSTVEEQTALHREIAVPPLVTKIPGKDPGGIQDDRVNSSCG